MSGPWFRCEYVRCGKANCRSCPHGPYWYTYRREGGRLRKTYHGLHDPRPDPVEVDHWAAIFNRATATEPLCRTILGVSDAAGRDECKRAFNRETLKNHPDLGGDTRRQAAINAAWAWLRARQGW